MRIADLCHMNSRRGVSRRMLARMLVAAPTGLFVNISDRQTHQAEGLAYNFFAIDSVGGTRKEFRSADKQTVCHKRPKFGNIEFQGFSN